MTMEILEACEVLVRRVGEFQKEYFRNVPDGAVDMKAARETVSFVDVESETILISGLEGLVEGAGFYGEESGKRGSQDLVWVIDPLDGTTNFLQGLDQYSISLALVKDGKTELGVVLKPATGEMFSCLRGHGVRHNGEVKGVNNPEVKANEVLYGTGFPYRSEDMVQRFFETAPKVLNLGLGIRRFGSAAIDVCYLSMGWFGGFWETDLQPYDIAAGMLFMEENGVIVTNERGEEFRMFEDRLFIAGLKNVHPELLAVVAEGYSSH